MKKANTSSIKLLEALKSIKARQKLGSIPAEGKLIGNAAQKQRRTPLERARKSYQCA